MSVLFFPTFSTLPSFFHHLSSFLFASCSSFFLSFFLKTYKTFMVYDYSNVQHPKCLTDLFVVCITEHDNNTHTAVHIHSYALKEWQILRSQKIYFQEEVSNSILICTITADARFQNVMNTAPETDSVTTAKETNIFSHNLQAFQNTTLYLDLSLCKNLADSWLVIATQTKYTSQHYSQSLSCFFLICHRLCF